MAEYTIFESDSEGNFSDEKKYTASGALKEKKVQIYDSEGVLVEEKKYDIENVFFLSIKHEYDNGLLKESRYYDIENNMVSKMEYRYKNRRLDRVVYYENGSQTSIVKIRYNAGDVIDGCDMNYTKDNLTIRMKYIYEPGVISLSSLNWFIR